MAFEFDRGNIHDTIPSESRTTRLVALWSFMVATKRAEVASEYACFVLVQDFLVSCPNDIHLPPT